MIKGLTFFSIFFFSICSFAQISANGNSGMELTSYTDGNTNDPIFIWCSDQLSQNPGSITATPTSGTGPFSFDWFFYDETSYSWASLTSETGSTSTLNNLPSDGYRVQIYDVNGNLVDCFVAWVWNLSADIASLSAIPSSCEIIDLNANVSSQSSFTYYNVPPPESLINSNTEITVCFTANHTYVSDLGFYLIGPASCGSPVIPVMPHPEAINSNNGCCCNSGNDVNNLCFTTNPIGNVSPCEVTTPLTGTYSGYSSAYGDNVTINWSGLYGCNAAQGGWRVQIFDCIGADVGALTSASISFSNLTPVCGSPTTINYSSGSISSAINDNSCTEATASIFQVPLPSYLTTPININADVAVNWTSSNPNVVFSNNSIVNPSVSEFMNGETTFYIDVVVDYNGITCSSNDSILTITNSSIQNDTIICNQTYQIVGTTTFGNFPGSWVSPNPEITFSNSGILNPLVTATQPGTYDITLETCRDTLTFQLTIPSDPVIINDTSICELTFQIQGTQAFSTGGTWTASSPNVTFSPSNTTLNPQIIASESGNYIITFTDNVCNNTDQANVTTIIPPSIFQDDIGCNLLYQVTGTTSFDGGVWSAADTAVHFTASQFEDNPLIWVSVPGNYTMTYTDNFCGIAVTADVLFPPFAYTQVLDTTICLGSTYTIYANQNSTVNGFTWSTGETGPSINVTEPGNYIVTGYNVCHSYSDTATIQVKKCDIEAPNVISLSSTVGNNIFFVQYEGIEKFTCTIVNRWGNKIYEYYDPAGGWDGKTEGGTVVEEGTYFYIIKAQFYGGEEITKQGFVQVRY